MTSPSIGPRRKDGIQVSTTQSAFTQQGGFLIGLLGDEPIATISAVKYGASFGFVGFYIRVRFLKCWINQPQGSGLGFLRKGSLAGYGVLRPCRSGYKVGPLFADSPEIAEDLFPALQENIPAHAPVFLDTPAVNAAAFDLAKRHNMTAIFETARMYAGGSPDLPIHRLFAVTNFELG